MNAATYQQNQDRLIVISETIATAWVVYMNTMNAARNAKHALVYPTIEAEYQACAIYNNAYKQAWRKYRKAKKQAYEGEPAR